MKFLENQLLILDKYLGKFTIWFNRPRVAPSIDWECMFIRILILPLWMRLTTSWHVITCHHVKLKGISWHLICTGGLKTIKCHQNSHQVHVIKCPKKSFLLTSWWHFMTYDDIWWHFTTCDEILWHFMTKHAVYHDISWHVMTNHEMTLSDSERLVTVAAKS